MHTARAVAFLALLPFVGCGYQWVRYGGALGDVRRVAILPLENDAFEPGVETLVTEALVTEFLRRGVVELVDDPAAADLVLSGAVEPLETRRRSFSSVEFALEYEVVLRLDLHARRPDGRDVPLDTVSLGEAELYVASPDVEVTRKNREEALRRLASLVAARVHDTLAERLGP